jgi:thioredoxin reductase (NADPH)
MPVRPVILIVDDDADGLSALRGALDRRYRADYRVIAHRSARAALEELAAIRRANEEIALVIADQWMPEMAGVDFLGRVHVLAPDAQRALLVAWGDRSAAPAILQACAFDQIENYLYKPWSPAEVHLYPLIGEYLADWSRAHGPSMELVKVVGHDPSPRVREIREYLERSGVPYGVYLEGSRAAGEVLASVGREEARLPVVVLLDGQVLEDPSNAELANVLGATELEGAACDVTIVGAGPAGLAAGVYAASEGLSTVIVEREVVGGQAGTSTLIRNYLGFPRGISGAELAQRAYQQAWLFGARYALAKDATALRARGADRIVRLADGREIVSRAVIVATGARYQRLAIPSLERFVGAGVFYTALVGADTGVMRGKDVVVVGGGNSAGQAVVHLAKYARKVLLLVRGASVGEHMSDYLVQAILRAPNVEIRVESEVIAGEGTQSLEALVVRDRAHGTTQTLLARTLFALIGARPHTDWLAGAVQRDSHGFILTGPTLASEPSWPLSRPPMQYETSLPGVFAVGDVRQGSAKRVSSAVGEGAAALQSVHAYLASGAQQ